MTSLLLRPVRLDPSLMFLYDNGGSDEGKNSEGGFTGGNFASNQCRSLMMAHAAASLAPSSAYSLSSSSGDAQHASAVGEPAKQCSPCSAAQNSSSASLPYGYFGGGGGGGYYSCRVPHHHSGLKPCATQPPSVAHYVDKYADAASAAAPPCEDAFGPRAKDFAFYPTTATSYPPGPYQPVPGYLDGPVAQPPEARHHEQLLPMESYAPWGLSTGGWGSPVYCPGKEQTHSGHMWKSPGQDSVCHATGDPGSYRRGRKKRVPYTKVQLKELEREYTANKFITKDKRRRISTQTGLSERQVTIWFQNRRVKEKKVVHKVKSVS